MNKHSLIKNKFKLSHPICTLNWYHYSWLLLLFLLLYARRRRLLLRMFYCYCCHVNGVACELMHSIHDASICHMKWRRRREKKKNKLVFGEFQILDAILDSLEFQFTFGIRCLAAVDSFLDTITISKVATHKYSTDIWIQFHSFSFDLCIYNSFFLHFVVNNRIWYVSFFKIYFYFTVHKSENLLCMNLKF